MCPPKISGDLELKPCLLFGGFSFLYRVGFKTRDELARIKVNVRVREITADSTYSVSLLGRPRGRCDPAVDFPSQAGLKSLTPWKSGGQVRGSGFDLIPLSREPELGVKLGVRSCSAI